MRPQKIIFVIITSLIYTLAQGQNSDNNIKIDSLNSLLKSHRSLDEKKVNILNELGYEYWIINPDRSEEYGLEALEIAKILPYEKGKAFANRVIGVAHWARGNIDLSFKFLLEAEHLYKTINDSLGLGNSMLNLGMAYADQLNFTNASQKYNQALSIFKSLNQNSRIATTYTKMADLLIQKEEYTSAYDYLIQALEIHKTNQFLYGIAEANSKMGKISYAKGAYNNAISYLLLAVESATRRNDHVGLADYYHSIGQSFYKKKDFKQALSYLALSKQFSEKYNLKKIQKELYETYKNIEVDQGNYQKAIGFYDQYLAVKDELFNEEKSNIISSMEARRAFDEKEQELRIAQKNLDLLIQKNKASNLTKLALILGLIAIAAFAWGLIQRKNKILLRKQKDLDQAHLKTNELTDTIKEKDQVLTSYTLNFVQKNELISTLKKSLGDLKVEIAKEHQPKVQVLQRKMESVLRIDEDWNDFRKHFENVHPQLIHNLNQTFPGLSKSEFKLIALIRLNLSSKEISSILGISPDSVKTARYRLRKKLNLDNQEDLFDFLIKYDQ